MAAVPSTGPATRAGVDAHALYERQYPLVLRFCRSKLRSREDAEDAAQTTFTYALGSLRQGTVPTTEAAWLLTIARNVCLNRWDAARRRSLVEVARDPHVLQEVSPGREDSHVDLIGLQDALGRLTEPQRRAILLREWQGLSYAEIATELDLSESAVETLLFRARRSVARELKGGRSLRDLGSLLGGLKSLFSAGAVKVAFGVAAVVAVGVAGAPQLDRTHLRPAIRPPAAPRTEAPITSSSRPRSGTAPPAGRASRPSYVSSAESAPATPAGSGPTTAPGSSADGPAASPAGPPHITPAPEAPANRSTPTPAAPPVPQLPSVETPPLPSLPAVPPLPVTPPVSVPSIPALPSVDPPAVTVPLPKLP